MFIISHSNCVILLNCIYNSNNYIKYFCFFECVDNIENIIESVNNHANYNICSPGTESVGVLVIQYYKYDSIGNYKWNSKTLVLSDFQAVIMDFENSTASNTILYVVADIAKFITSLIDCGNSGFGVSYVHVKLAKLKSHKIQILIIWINSNN